MVDVLHEERFLSICHTTGYVFQSHLNFCNFSLGHTRHWCSLNLTFGYRHSRSFGVYTHWIRHIKNHCVPTFFFSVIYDVL